MRLPLFLVLSSIILFYGSCKNKKKGLNVKTDSTLVYYEFHDFESLADSRTDSTKASSGKKSGLLNGKIEYSFGLDKKIRDISSYKNIDKINVSFKCLMDKQYSDATFVFSIDDTISGKNILWEGLPIKTLKLNEWDPVIISYKVNKRILHPEYVLKLYIWNQGKNTFYFDDISYAFIQHHRYKLID